MTLSKVNAKFEGRRREDREVTDPLPDDLKHGDYWKLLVDGRPMSVSEPNKLTTDCWQIYFDGFGIFTLTKHTVREGEDGKISIRPNDGSSNSILVSKGTGDSWHGYCEDGVFYEV